jgi:hypothetical protein
LATRGGTVTLTPPRAVPLEVAVPSYRLAVFVRGLFLGLLAVLTACATPAAPSTVCKTDADCGGLKVCKAQECVVPTYPCETVADCQTVTGKLEPPAGSIEECLQTVCSEAKTCEKRPVVNHSCTGSGDDKCAFFACNADGQCKPDVSKVAEGFCAVDGQCVPGGTKHGACEVCDPANPKAWTPLPATATCTGDDSKCSDYQCDGKGACQAALKPGMCHLGKGECEADGTAKPKSDGCTVCNVGNDPKNWTKLDVGDACTPQSTGGACHTGTCKADGSCQSGGVTAGFCFVTPSNGTGPECFADKALDPGNTCKFCQSSKSDVWSDLSAGTTCTGDKVSCTKDSCDGQGTCISTPDDGACTSLNTPCTIGRCKASNDTGCVTEPLPTTATCTDLDGIACTLEHCDGKGTCDPTALSFDATACEDGSPCTEEACEKTVGCVHTPKDAACDDGNVCTLDSCAGKSGCVHTFADGTACDSDNLACTVQSCSQGACKVAILGGTCAIDGACHAKDESTGGGCQVCNPTAAQDKWTLIGKGVTCEADSLACTDDLCDGAGSCKHDQVKAGTCNIAGFGCKAGGDVTEGGCQVCEPTLNQTAWTLKAVGTTCASDSVTCTIDTCDAGGKCDHKNDDGACKDSLSCVTHVCNPKGESADALTGCVKIDTCPWGHSCDAQKNACLTGQVQTLPGVTGQPTNPALVRHVLDATAGTHRTWVVYQDAPVSSVVSGGWQITGKAALHAVILDDVVAAADKKPLPPVVTLPAALTWKASGTVAQGYPVVVNDPLNPAQAWLSWLEADPAGGGCLTGAGVGGVLRLARLDGTVVKSGDVAVAGEQCSLTANASPMFMTQGMAMIDALGVAANDPGARGVLSLRPNGTNLQTVSTAQVEFVGPVDSKQDQLIAGGPFSKVHPVVVDTGSKSGTRYYGLALTEKGTTTVNRKLWALPVDSAGVETDATTWLQGNTPATSTAGDLDGVTAVCSLDATVNAAGTVGVLLVVRRAGNDEILLAERDVAGKTTVVKQGTQPSFGDCAYGWTSARLAPLATGWYIDVQNADGSALSGNLLIGKSGSILAPITGQFSLTTDSSAASTVPALAWRGLAQPLVQGGNVTLVIEGKEPTTKAASLRITTFQP